ncbi:MAG TPA: hypothetical protein VFB82_24260, partial [Blastocatellia bacterium]|nr:hypothetical protein [Blastocatellia bacterium]
MSSPDQSDSSDKPVSRNNPRVVAENISAILKMRAEKEREKSLQERAADALTLFSGSMLFVY